MTDQADDWNLVARVRAGDAPAFDALMGRYKRPVLNFIYRMTGDSSEAEDLAQEVFVKTYRQIREGRLQPTAAFSTWLFKVARNEALDDVRRRKRKPLDRFDDKGEGVDSIAGREKNASDEAISHETEKLVADAVSQLPEDQKSALILSVYQGCSQADIAAILSCSIKAVESRLYRARQYLQIRLGRLL